MQWLEKEGAFDSQDDDLLQDGVVAFLVDLMLIWVRQVAAQHGVPAELANVEVFAIGSFRLGAHSPGTAPPAHGPPLSAAVQCLRFTCNGERTQEGVKFTFCLRRKRNRTRKSPKRKLTHVT